MKELSIEEKARRYDEALALMQECIPDDNGLVHIRPEDIFPKLAESKDEKIRKWLICTLKSLNNSPVQIDGAYEMMLPAIAWLEKQGERKPYGQREECSDCQFNYAGECKGYCAMKRGEQKPVDKIEPKFHEGEWINGYYTNYKVLSVNNEGYVVEDTDGNKINILFENEKFHHLFTIADAKDGDVLVASDDSIFLFKGAIDYACKHYVALTTDGAVKFNEGLEHYWETTTAVHPATKEQRDKLEKAITEAGYEWDAELKQLRKIEQKPATMSLDEAIEHCKEKSCGNSACALEHKQLEKWLTELKELKEQKPAWSEEDKSITDNLIQNKKQ